MDIRFIFEGDGRLVQLPVNPERLTITYPGDNQRAQIVGIGEVNVLKDRKLAEIEIECVFPRHDFAPWVLTKGDFEGPEFYIDFFLETMKSKSPINFTVTGLNIDMPVSVESFTKSDIAGDTEVSYTLALAEYKDFSAKVLQTKTTATAKTAVSASAARANVNKTPTIGCSVIVNGRLHSSSYGDGPGQTRTNYKGKLSDIRKGRSHPYHVTTPDGGWLGWVIETAIKVV